jgi:glycosyltransferase 2 family protein
MRRPGASAAVGLVVSAVSLGAVVWWIAHQPAPRPPASGVGFALLGLALLLGACTLGLRGWRWHRVLVLAGIAHRHRDAYGLTVVGYMGNNVLPVRGGELLKIALLGPRTNARRRELLGTVVADRLLDAAVLAALFAALTFADVEGAPNGRGGAAVAVGALVGGAICLGLYVSLRRRGRFERFAALIRPVARAFRLFARPHGVPLAAVSVVIWLLEGVTFLMIARAVDVELSLVAALAVVVLASLAAAIPAAPGYVGTFDAAVLVGLHAAGVDGGDAVAVLVLARFMLFVPVTFVGLGALMLGYGGLHRPARLLERSPGDRQELLAEEPPGERRREVASGQRSVGW